MQHIIKTITQPGSMQQKQSCSPYSITIDILFQRMGDIYGKQWTMRFSNQLTLNSAKQEWANGLSKLSGQQIKNGLQECVFSGKEWPPSLPKFITYCTAQDLSAAQSLFVKLPSGKKANLSVVKENMKKIRLSLQS